VKLATRAFWVGFLLCASLNCLVAQTNGGKGTTTGHASATPSNIIGNWQGTLIAGPTKLPIVLKIAETSAGQLSATLDLPDQGTNGLPVERISYADRILSFDVDIGASASYEGAVSRDATEVVGQFKQGRTIVPLTLSHPDAKPEASAAKPAVLVNPRRKLELQPCGVSGVTKDGLCAQYEVYEDRAKNTGRKIKLYVMVLPALVDKSAPDPIFYLLGGPGGAATSAATAGFMTQLHRTRDVVLVDQRGTGKSNPLPCDLSGAPNDMRNYFVEGMSSEAVGACRAALEKNADLRLYTTTIAMADLDDVRSALGYDKINVYGGSYGATTALAYLRLYPQHVRAAVVSGVAPPSLALPLSFAKGVEHALNRLLDDCSADEKCRAAFPDLRKDWAAVVETVNKGPVTFDTLNPLTRQKQQITMTQDGFAELVRHMLYVPTVMSIMPTIIHQMSLGDYSQFAFYGYQVQRQIDAALSRGMSLSVICAEDVPFIKDSDIEREMNGTFYGGRRAHLYRRACEQWPRGDVPANFRDPIKSDVPVLMLSGELDPVTPPDLATPLLRWLPNGRQVLMHNATHYPYDCAEKLAREFIEHGDAKALDASCVDQIKREPFITSLPPLPIPK
jgi:pimeloyl-ACP methyl ester carboxylesterase